MSTTGSPRRHSHMLAGLMDQTAWLRWGERRAGGPKGSEIVDETRMAAGMYSRTMRCCARQTNCIRFMDAKMHLNCNHNQRAYVQCNLILGQSFQWLVESARLINQDDASGAERARGKSSLAVCRLSIRRQILLINDVKGDKQAKTFP